MIKRVIVDNEFIDKDSGKFHPKGQVLYVVSDNLLNTVDEVVVDEEYEYVCDVGSVFYNEHLKRFEEE